MKRLLVEYFDRYFNLMRNDSDIGERELQEIVPGPVAKKRILQKGFCNITGSRI